MEIKVDLCEMAVEDAVMDCRYGEGDLYLVVNQELKDEAERLSALTVCPPYRQGPLFRVVVRHDLLKDNWFMCRSKTELM